MIIGQEKLLNLIDSFDYKSLPHSIAIIGGRGSGKSLISRYLIQKFSKVSIEEIDGRELSELDQNKLLKTIEEPLPNQYFIIEINHDVDILKTLLDRCFLLRIEPYPLNQLELFGNLTQTQYSILDTPGKILKWREEISRYQELANLIITKLQVASVANTLSLSKKNLDYQLLIDCIKVILTERADISYDYNFLKIISSTNEKLRFKNVNKDYVFELFLLELKGIYNV